MEQFTITEQQLLNFIDGNCSTDESRKIKDMIESSKVLEAQYNELLFMHKSLSQYPLVSAPDGFRDKVMANLSSKAISIEGLFDSINRLGLKLLVVVLILIGITVTFVASDSVALNLNGLLTNTTTVLETYNINVSPVNTLLGDKLILNGLLFVGTVFSLVLFDRVILKPWFSRRNRLNELKG